MATRREEIGKAKDGATGDGEEEDAATVCEAALTPIDGRPDAQLPDAPPAAPAPDARPSTRLPIDAGRNAAATGHIRVRVAVAAAGSCIRATAGVAGRVRVALAAGRNRAAITGRVRVAGTTPPSQAASASPPPQAATVPPSQAATMSPPPRRV
ncbi:hypothetical protein OsJ_35607 [Oryza sativa Japonica Group]|uniref:Uncharacterized protein n=1 Tax=Oryza sativa subsp. japonica TaxID=39947 RepID=B9GCF6_ORYSJ|nr:hypothetical protein OsJ_35607 [Oryza sativa Japonica Group]